MVVSSAGAPRNAASLRKSCLSSLRSVYREDVKSRTHGASARTGSVTPLLYGLAANGVLQGQLVHGGLARQERQDNILLLCHASSSRPASLPQSTISRSSFTRLGPRSIRHEHCRLSRVNPGTGDAAIVGRRSRWRVLRKASLLWLKSAATSGNGTPIRCSVLRARGQPPLHVNTAAAGRGNATNRSPATSKVGEPIPSY